MHCYVLEVLRLYTYLTTNGEIQKQTPVTSLSRCCAAKTRPRQKREDKRGRNAQVSEFLSARIMNK